MNLRHHESHSSRTVEYTIWITLKARCYNPKHRNYPDYGGRGIVVCDAWRRDYRAFLADMGRRPSGTSIDRIDNDGPYAPENCRWADRCTQRRNQRRFGDVCKQGHPLVGDNVRVVTGGKRQCLTCNRAAKRRWYYRQAVAVGRSVVGQPG